MSLANVIPNGKALPGGNPSPFPAMMWKPDGSSYIANSAGEVQPDSTPYHPDNAPPPKAAEVQPEPPKVESEKPAFPLTRKEVIAHLTEGGIQFQKNAPHAEVYALLLEAVKNALAEADIAFDTESTDAPALLELLPKV